MTDIQERSTTSLLSAVERDEIELLPGLLVDAVFGTSAGVSLPSSPGKHVFGLTTVPTAARRKMAVAADEVRQLCDDIRKRGLTRQEIARGIGIDRRSLSGYASGEINPRPERLEALRILERISREIDAERPKQARDVLLMPRGHETLLDVVASGHYAAATAWRTWIARLEALVEIRPRATKGDPIWSAAAKAFANGQLAVPARASTVRPSDAYEMDMAEAEAFAEEPEAGRRRRSYT